MTAMAPMPRRGDAPLREQGAVQRAIRQPASFLRRQTAARKHSGTSHKIVIPAKAGIQLLHADAASRLGSGEYAGGKNGVSASVAMTACVDPAVASMTQRSSADTLSP